jgi:hypothetical protein
MRDEGVFDGCGFGAIAFLGCDRDQEQMQSEEQMQVQEQMQEQRQEQTQVFRLR